MFLEYHTKYLQAFGILMVPVDFFIYKMARTAAVSGGPPFIPGGAGALFGAAGADVAGGGEPSGPLTN